MNQDMKARSTVNGFLFGDEEDIELANQELSAIHYIDKRIENRSGETVLGVYQGALEKRMFRTPVGYCYLHDLQKRMLRLGIRREQITPVPLYQVFNDSYKTEERPKRIQPVKKNKNAVRRKLRNSVIANVILVILVISLFAIAMTGETPNILNYRNAVTNQYASWDEELTEREQAVREKERELGISESGQE